MGGRRVFFSFFLLFLSLPHLVLLISSAFPFFTTRDLRQHLWRFRNDSAFQKLIPPLHQTGGLRVA